MRMKKVFWAFLALLTLAWALTTWLGWQPPKDVPGTWWWQLRHHGLYLTGVWSVGSLASGASASLTITVTASGAVGTSLTNTAQITTSSLPDPDSTVNNGATGEDDYASRTATIGANTINCPSGSSASGSGFASSGSSAKLGQLFWLDWSCTGTSQFNAGAIVNKTWTAGDGLTITGQITGLTKALLP